MSNAEVWGKYTTWEELIDVFPWIGDAEIENARIEILEDKTLVWHSGEWHGGTWKDGTWLYGLWHDGVWEDGIWENGVWYNGVWEGGIWENGTWEYGEWRGGVWENGVWEDGDWIEGTWNDGLWLGGTWKDGEWYGGTREITTTTKIAREKRNQDSAVRDVSIYNIAHVGMRTIADIILRAFPEILRGSVVSIKDIKKLAKQDSTFKQMLTKKEGQKLLIAYPNGFSVDNIIEFAKSLVVKKGSSKLPSLFDDYTSNIKLGHTVWTGMQRYSEWTENKVLQFNLPKAVWREKVWPAIIEYVEQKAGVPVKGVAGNVFNHIERLLKRGGSEGPGGLHPISKRDVTLAWVRYSVLELGDVRVVVDEVQSEFVNKSLKNYKFGDLFLEAMETVLAEWAEYVLKTFIRYVRQVLRIRKIYYPTLDTKKHRYKANPPAFLYKELPNKFGFKKDSDMEGFMVLENCQSVELRELQHILESF